MNENRSIKISPKYGLNVTMAKCFWCRKEDVGIAICGRLPGDKKAPPCVISSYEPCDKCREYFEQGILVVGCVDSSQVPEDVCANMPPICHDEHGNPYYPGCYIVMTEQGIGHILDDQVLIDKAVENKVVFLPNDFIVRIIEDANKLIKEEDSHEANNCWVQEDNRDEPDEKD